ncbi:phage major capsid protein [Actinocrispum wychmicini]|uniref:HK97 family phage major capsid protein n=1 Tax=Actinocrispum wychmicini TaxID=1213861 RepID=A0A4R2JZZ7_9PSEU|nr:phage major capsid protein [Actinocrispum wychmicini]TCO64947.1 HK97 family phage major capsid protein [Actinocrispum wychmicini]
MLEFLRQQLQQLLEARATLKSDLDQILVAPTTDKRNLTAEEDTAFSEKRDAIKAKDTEIQALDARIAEVTEIEERSQRVDQLRAELGQTGEQRNPAVSARVTSEPTTYHRGSKHSYFLDLARVDLRRGDADGGVTAAQERLQRHGKEMDVELPAREKRRADRARKQLENLDSEEKNLRAESGFEKRVNPNRVDGQGGYFVPPLWLVDEYVDLPRFGRAFMNTVRNMDLPSGTDSVNVPKIATGTATGMQTADAAAVTSQDATDTFITAPVRTIAGQQDVALQLLDQSPVGFDEILFTDLISDLNMRLDIQGINGSGAAGQLKGLFQVAGVNTVTYTDATPTLAELWPFLMQGLSLSAKNRKMMPSAMFLTPSRWFWMASYLDSQNRPLITPETNAPFNPMALQTGGDVEGPVGRILQFPLIADGNIPNNLGAGTNEEWMFNARTSDMYLWEGAKRTRVLQEVLSGTLQVRFQVYEYVAFMADRRPEQISILKGTGLLAPAGY